MNILHIVQSFDISGRSRVIYELSSALNKDGFGSWIVSLTDNCRFTVVESNAECLHLNKKEGLDIPTIMQLIGIIKKDNISLIHTHGKGALLYGIIAKKLTRAKLLVHTVHRSDADIFKHNSLVENLIKSSVDKVVGVSDAARLSFIRNHNFPEAKTTTIYNGINISKYAGATDKVRKGLIIGTVMNFANHKDYDTLILAFAEVLKIYPDSQLIMIGDGPNAPEVKKLVQEKKVAEHVKFLGFRKDVPDLLKTFDIFVISSHTEGLGLAILESMAARVPVVVSYVDGAREAIDDGVSGIFFQHGDYQGLKDIIISLHTNEQLYNSLREKGYEWVTSKFSLEKMYEDYKKVYESLSKT